MVSLGRKIVHVIAVCHDCSWEEQDYNKAAKKGREHARKTGHEVSIETCYSQIYNLKGE